MQESGLTEIIPLIFTTAIWSQHLLFSHPEFPQGSPQERLRSGGCEMAGIIFLRAFPPGSPAPCWQWLRPHQ